MDLLAPEAENEKNGSEKWLMDSKYSFRGKKKKKRRGDSNPDKDITQKSHFCWMKALWCKMLCSKSISGEKKSHCLLIKNSPSSWFNQQRCLRPEYQPPEPPLTKEVKTGKQQQLKKKSSSREYGTSAWLFLRCGGVTNGSPRTSTPKGLRTNTAWNRWWVGTWGKSLICLAKQVVLHSGPLIWHLASSCNHFVNVLSSLRVQMCLWPSWMPSPTSCI